MKRVRLIGGALLCLLTTATPAVADAPVHVDPSVRYGVWQGWGTSLAWWANVIGGFPEAARREYMVKAFDPVSGLGLNVVRYNIGGGENPSDLPPSKSALDYRARVPGFEDVSEHWNWSADANQRWVLRRAIAMGRQPHRGVFQLAALLDDDQRQRHRRKRRREQPRAGQRRAVRRLSRHGREAFPGRVGRDVLAPSSR